MALQPTPVSWPITGGIDSKKAPLMLAPGSQLVLDNIRQERLNEWRARTGFTHSAADDMNGVAPVRAVPLIGGGMISMDRQAGNASALQTYVPSLANSRWARGSTANAGQSTPGHWVRKPVARAKDDNPLIVGYASSPIYALVAHWGQTSGVFGIYATLQSVAEGENIATDPLVSSTGIYSRCVYDSNHNLLCLFWIEPGANALKLSTWNGSTGAPVTVAATLVTSVNAAGNMDAFAYGGTTVTVAFRSVTADQLRFLEVNPATPAVSTNVLIAISASVSVNLMPDPDLGAKRNVIVGGAAGTNVLTIDNAGTVFTNDNVSATAAINAGGVAYNTGSGAADWMLVAQFGFSIVACKRRLGVVSAIKTLIPSGSGSYTLDTNAWREPNTDLTHFMVGLHNGFPDVQSNYYEMAIEFENGAGTISNLFPEPQARILPLNAGASAFGFCSQVQRLGTDKFAVALIRLAREGLAANAIANQYAIDAWTVEYANDTNRYTLNIGPGLMTSVGSFIPAGSLLQSNTGGVLWSHGMSTIPFQLALTPGAGGSLTVSATYHYVVSVDVPDEVGNVWPGPPSIAAFVTLGGAQNQITVTVKVIQTENNSRPFTYKIWRSKANGLVYQLVNSRTGTVASLGTSFTYVDQTSDATLASGDFLSVEDPASITPAFLHTAFFGGRIYGVMRDFPTRINFSKPIVFGRSPEFPDDFILDINDEFGDCTGLAALDDKLVVFKAMATYVVFGDGPNNAGTGSLQSITRISSDAGSIVGAPVVSTGDEAYFQALLGIYRITRSTTIDFIGSPVDQFFNQPTIQTPETLTGAMYDRESNEVRLQTTNYRLIYNRLFGCWSRDTGGMPGSVMTRALPVATGTTQLIFRSNGQVWQESGTATDDAGTTFQALIRSAQVRAAQFEGRFRLYKARLLCIRTAGGASVSDPRLTITFDNDDTISETFAPRTAILAGTTPVRIEADPRRQLCSTFTLQLTFPVSDATWRIEQWGVVVGAMPGPQPLAVAQRWT